MTMPIFHQPGQGFVGDHGAYRSILDAAHDAALGQALAAYDVAVARRDALARTSPPAQRADVEAAYRAEERAAARQGRPATMAWADVQAAEATEAEHTARSTAADDTVAATSTALTDAIRHAGAAILAPLAVARARAIEAGEDLKGSPRHPVERLWQLIMWPPLAYGPAMVNTRSELSKWWPLAVAVDDVAWLSSGAHSGLRADWNEWAWRQLARPEAYTITDAGALLFAETWAPPAVRPSRRRGVVVAAGMVPAADMFAGLHPGDLVMHGTGPNGERGVTADDMARHPLG